MSEYASCPHCKTNYRVPPEVAGREVRCAKCGGLFALPAPPPAPSAAPSNDAGILDDARRNVAAMLEESLSEESERKAAAEAASASSARRSGRGKRCPRCGWEFGATDVSCPACRWENKTGGFSRGEASNASAGPALAVATSIALCVAAVVVTRATLGPRCAGILAAIGLYVLIAGGTFSVVARVLREPVEVLSAFRIVLLSGIAGNLVAIPLLLLMRQPGFPGVVEFTVGLIVFWLQMDIPFWRVLLVYAACNAVALPVAVAILSSCV